MLRISHQLCHFSKTLSVMVLLLFLSLDIAFAAEKTGLLIIAHGSHDAKWTKPILELEKQVEKILFEKEDNPFSKVKVAFLESEPLISSVANEFEKCNVGKIYVIPLFIAPSCHSQLDVPAVLGIYSEPGMRKALLGEGTEIVDANVSFVLGPTMNFGDLLREVMLDRVKELSENPESEAVVILAHGCKCFRPKWEKTCLKVGAYICAKTGIEFFDYAFVEVGQAFMSDGLHTIFHTLDKYKRVLVVGMFLAISPQKIAKDTSIKVGKFEMKGKKFLEHEDVIFSKKAILPDERVAKWIVDTAIEMTK